MNPNIYKTALEKKGSPLFIPFTVLGDPGKESSLKILETLVESGADALELGFPFSDPPADGPVIQAADMRALKAGIRTDDCFDLLKAIRSKTEIPIGLLMYYNLIYQRGVDRFYGECAAAGVTSVLIADLPLEHAEEVLPYAKNHGIAPVFIVSEIASDDRIKAISKIADGYLYVVSYVGITGVEDSVLEDRLSSTIQRIRQYTDLPLCVGFGINSASQVKTVVQAGADGVIVGSRIIRVIPNFESVGAVCKELSVACTSHN